MYYYQRTYDPTKARQFHRSGSRWLGLLTSSILAKQEAETGWEVEQRPVILKSCPHYVLPPMGPTIVPNSATCWGTDAEAHEPVLETIIVSFTVKSVHAPESAMPS